jgi:hypothetical protein
MECCVLLLLLPLLLVSHVLATANCYPYCSHGSGSSSSSSSSSSRPQHAASPHGACKLQRQRAAVSS